MDFSLNDDRRMLQETLTRFLSDTYPIEKRNEIAATEERFSADVWAKFAELGIIGALFSEETGGFGGEGVDLMVVFEAVGRHLVVEPFLPTLMAGTVLAENGKNDLVERAITGEAMLSFAHGEPSSRYELAHVSCSAKEANGEWQISGHKSVVLGAPAATHFIVSARTSGDADDQDGISLFLVEKSDAISIRDYGTLDGYAAAELYFDSAKAELLGEQGSAYALIELVHSKAVTALSAEMLGAMEIAKDLTVDYMKQRKQFGVAIGQFQALQHRMADVIIEIEQMRSAVINIAGNLSAERVTREKHASSAKYLAGTIGRQVAEEAIQIHGGMGMTWEYAVGHYSKRIIMADHLFGDTDHHLERYIQLGKEG